MMLQIMMIIRIVMLKVFEAMAKKGLETMEEEKRKAAALKNKGGVAPYPEIHL